MTEHLPELLYPLGFLAGLFFASRMLLQWVSSELSKRSIVTKGFWRLSLIGNLFLALHSVVQLQYHVLLVQTINAIISWRNLNLMGSSAARVKFSVVIKYMIFGTVFSTLLFLLGQRFFSIENEWFRIPVTPWSPSSGLTISPIWHFVGILGLILFNSRFWIQWWLAETYQISFLGKPFFWLSLIGDLLCLFYFLAIQDPANFLGPLLGLVPCIRNLWLIYKEEPWQKIKGV
jgi:lipid-A-disaccharide synthase-like uncharacterized protein